MTKFQITYYAYGMTPILEDLPEGTTEEQAIAKAREYAADPHRGFSSLREIRKIDIG